MRAVVTGANGFIGRNLVRGLLGEGHEVLALVRRPEKVALLRSAGSEVAVASLEDEDRLVELLRRTDALFHLANVMVFATRREQWRSNVLNMRRVVRAARRAAVGRLVYTSSVAVYGSTGDEWVDEESPKRPTTHYGRTKVSAEAILAEESEGLEWSVLRPGVVYGPGSSLLYHMTRKGPVLLHEGYNWLPMVHVVDVVSALMAAWKDAPHGRAYNVVDDRPIRLRQFVEAVAKEAGVPLRRASYTAAFVLATILEAGASLRGRVPKLTRDVLRLYRTSVKVSNHRIKEELGFTLKYPDPLEALPEALGRVKEPFAL